jgi:hypothetical protein
MTSHYALNLLRSYYPSISSKSKKIKRGTKLISNTSGANNTLDNDNWFFELGYCFRESLGLNFESRMVNKKPMMVWTQKPIIYFKSGDLIFSKCKNYSVQIMFSAPMGWDDESNSMYEGLVTFNVASWVNQNIFTKYLGQTSFTQVEFLALLIDGPTLLFESELTPYDSEHLLSN